MAAPHLLLRVESNGTNGTGGWRRPPPRMNTSSPGTATPARRDSSRDELRREMRKRRRALTDAQRALVARAIARIITRLRILRPGTHIAVYLAYRGEADLAPVIALARRRGCRLYLPTIASIDKGSMRFVRFETARPLRRNRFGILEPDPRTSPAVETRRLDVVFLPLVAVDARGWRLGSGAGFYDRRLSHLRADRRWRRPKLIGIAYDFQRVPAIEPQPWDVPLDALVTERAFYPSHRTHRHDPQREVP